MIIILYGLLYKNKGRIVDNFRQAGRKMEDGYNRNMHLYTEVTMKKLCSILFCSFVLLVNPVVSLAQYEPLLLEDALYSVLFPQINKAFQDHYGKQKPYACPKLVTMKKVYSGTYLFYTVVEVIKYERGPDGQKLPPFERVRITFQNDEGEWEVKKLEIKRLPNDVKLKCPKPI